MSVSSAAVDLEDIPHKSDEPPAHNRRMHRRRGECLEMEYVFIHLLTGFEHSVATQLCFDGNPYRTDNSRTESPRPFVSSSKRRVDISSFRLHEHGHVYILYKLRFHSSLRQRLDSVSGMILTECK